MWSLSPKIAAAAIFLAIFAFVAGAGLAQEPPEPQEPPPAPEEGRPPEGEIQPMDPGQVPPSPGQEPSPEVTPIPIPIGEEDTRTFGGQTFIDDVFQSTRNRWGFSLNAYQAYTTDVAVYDEPRESSGITAFIPRIFFNAGRRKSTFHLDLGTGYRMYNNKEDMNSWDYSGNANYSHRFSKRTALKVTNQFTSAFNDAWSFLNLHSPISHSPNSSNEVLFNRQRINRNSFLADLSHQFGRKANLSLSGGYRWYDYAEDALNDSQTIDVGAFFHYRLAKWLYLASSFESYWNIVETDRPDSKIYRLRAAGVEFQLSDSWRIWADGGVGISDYETYIRTREDISAGISYVAKDQSFNLTYQRGFTSAIGLSDLLISDIYSTSYGYRINPWVNTSLQAYYYRSSELDGGLLETFSGGGGLEFALRRDLFLTLNTYFQNQQTRNFSVDGLGLNRLTAYAGLQYVWPAGRRY